MIGILPEYENKIVKYLENLKQDSNSEAIFLIDKAGIPICSAGTISKDDTTFASLTAGNVAASEAVSRLLNDDTISHMFTETKEHGIYYALVDKDYIIAVVFDKDRTNLGTVHVMFKKWAGKIRDILEEAKRSGNVIAEDVQLDNVDFNSLFE